ncbi:MAG: DnaJ domain-containing protein [Deltaproteobacteria bacterium]|nr:DnaJ domain-containing protein [Deltaproteobacteria bacterium]
MGISIRLPDDGIPSLLPAADFSSKELTVEDGFLLSRIDGGTNMKALRALTTWPGDRTDESVAKLMVLRMVQVRLKDGEIIALTPRALNELKIRMVRGKTGATGGLAASLGGLKEAAPFVLPAGTDTGMLSVEVATHVMRAIERGSLGYWYEVLSISPRADVAAIKKAYRAIAAEIHPDNFFGKELGTWGERLNDAFDLLTRAYDTLSDPAERARYNQELADMDAPEPEEPAEPEAEEVKVTAQEKPKPGGTILDQIRMKVQKARDLARTAEQQMNQGHWQDAFNALQMAATFDPYNPDYKKKADMLRPKLNIKRAKEMFQEAVHMAHNPKMAKAALKLLEEVVDIDPARPAHRYEYARLLFQERENTIEGGYLGKAMDHVEAALIMEPENPKYLLLAGQICKAMGNKKAAADYLKKTLKKDKNNETARQELDSLKD